MTPPEVPFRPEDQAARRLAQREFTRPVALEAGAGTGKTTALVARVLAWSLGDGWRRAEDALSRRARELGEDPATLEADRIAVRVLSGVVAITFTEAAAAEMAGRIADGLRSVLVSESIPGFEPPVVDVEPLFAGEELRRRARALLGTLDHLTAKTIHAWCLGLLAEHPLEAGLHPRLTVDAEGREVQEMVAEAVETAYGRAWTEAEGSAEGPGALRTLALHGHGPGDVAEALETLVFEGVEVETLEDDPGGPEACRTFADELAAAVDALARLARPLAASTRTTKPREVLEVLDLLADRLDEMTQESFAVSANALAELCRDVPEDVQQRVKDWSRERFSKTSKKTLGEDLEATAAAAAELLALLRHGEQLDVLSLAHRALAFLLRRVRGEMARRGVMTFQDLLLAATRLLEDRPTVAARVRRRMDQLLVDEFQDTDDLQCRILEILALQGPEAERPGLFLVGDPKQSIYGWRNADLAAYESFLDRLRDADGRVEPLTQNFRSVPEVLAEAGRVVEPVMREEAGLQPAYQPLTATPSRSAEEPFTTGHRAPVEHWISWREDQGADTRNLDADTLEARALAADLRDLHDGAGVPWREAALLFRSTTGLEPYLEALRDAGVPFQVTGDRQYYRRREVIEAAALVRTVLDPGDHLALLTLLRSSMVGVPDAALLPLWHRDLPHRASKLGVAGRAGDGDDEERLDRLAEDVRAVARDLPPGIPGLESLAAWDVSLTAALEHLALARRAYALRPADEVVELLRTLFLPEPVEAARYLGAYRRANLERFFRRLLQDLQEAGDTGAVLRRLRLAVREARELPESSAQEATEDAVRILTIHGAKGLEFDHVYLPQLHRGRRGGGSPGTEVLRHGGERALALLGARGRHHDHLAVARRRVEEAEQVRLLYVATTRARRRLVLLGRWDGGNVRGTLVELLHERRDTPDRFALWHQATTARDAAAETGALRRRDDHGVLWRFPALEDLSPTPLGTPDATTAPDPRLLEEEARRLEARREDARDRQARPWSGAASAEAHERLRELLEETPRRGSENRATDARGDDGERLLRMALGTAVHQVLERLDFAALAAPDGDPRDAVEAAAVGLEADLERLLPAAAVARATDRARHLLDTLAEGPLLPRLASLAGRVVARELPILLPAQEAPDASETSEPPAPRPTCFVAGAVDLLYRDPEDDHRLVVADWKTDALTEPADIATRAAAYAPQGAIYCRAVREALGLPATPRFELWFLHAGEVIPVDLEDPSPDPSPEPNSPPGSPDTAR